MFSVRNSLVREKKFPKLLPDGRRPHHAVTLTDDHTLFLLHQQRDMIEKRSARKKGFFKR